MPIFTIILLPIDEILWAQTVRQNRYSLISGLGLQEGKGYTDVRTDEAKLALRTELPQ
jgi:hypothetical protein